MDVKVEAELSGFSSGGESLRIRASGPVRRRKGEFPDLALDLDADAGGAQPVSLGFISADGRLFFKFADTAYELPVDPQRSAGNPCGRKGLGIDPRPWVEEADAHEDETIGGVRTAHASGTLDSDRMLRDLNDFIARCGELLGATGAAVEPLPRKQLDQAAKELRDPSFDVYVGKDDGLIRRLSASIAIEPTAGGEDGEDERGPISLKFSVEFADVNSDQAIEAPANARPLSELQSQLGVDALRDGLGLGPQESDDGYTECLDRIAPDDTEGLERCNALLNSP